MMSVFDDVVAKELLQRMSENFHIVEDKKCYRSAQLSAQRLASYVKKFGIKTVINLRGKQSAKTWWQKESSMAQELGVMLINIPMHSKKLPLKSHIKSLIEAFKNAQNPVLLHCVSGVNRTGLASAVWMLVKQGVDKAAALKQFDTIYGYQESLFPEKKKFITLWQGEKWALQEYDPSKY